MRASHALTLLSIAAACLASFAPDTSADDAPVSLTKRLESMSPEEKNELFRKKERFYSLSPAEQQRLRNLHKRISSDKQSEQLRQTLVHYTQWLQTLDPIQQAELQGMSLAERIAKVKEIRQQQQAASSPPFFNTKLPSTDVWQILRWIQGFIDEHEQEIIAKLPREYAQRIKSIPPGARRHLVRRAYVGGYSKLSMPRPDERDIDRLKRHVTPQTRELVDQPDSWERLIDFLSKVDFRRRMPISDQQLREFARDVLPEEERQKLDDMPIEDRHRMLREMFLRHKQQKRPGGDGPFSRGRNSFPRQSSERPSAKRSARD